MIPLFLAEEEEENSSSMARQKFSRDLTDPLDCYDDLELVQRFRFSRSSISRITELIAHRLQIAPMPLPHIYRFVLHFSFLLLERSR